MTTTRAPRKSVRATAQKAPPPKKELGPHQTFVPEGKTIAARDAAMVGGTASKKPPSIWLREGTQVKLRLHHGQQRTWASTKRFILMLAGTQGGKTSFGPWWLYREIQRNGGADYLAVTGSFEMFKLKMLPTMRETFEHVLQIGRYWSGPGVIELCDPATGKFLADRADSPMWGRIILRSAMSRGGLESTTAAAAWLDEAGQNAFDLSVWEAILRRLSLYQGRALVTTTLYESGGWLRTLSDKWEKGDPNIDVIRFASTQNPAFSEEEFARARNDMQAHRFSLFYLGEFAKPPGAIYDLEPSQIIRPFSIPASWIVYAGVDFGAVNTATVWVAHDPTEDIFIAFQERLEGNMTTEEHCSAVLGLSADYTMAAWYGGAPSETQQRMDWRANDVPVLRPLLANLESGIDGVATLIKHRRLYVFDDCTGLIENLQNYRRETDEAGVTSDRIRDKERFHFGDALRYVAPVLGSTMVTAHESIW